MEAYQVHQSVAKACRTLNENGIEANYQNVLREMRKNGFALVGHCVIQRMEDGTVTVEFKEPFEIEEPDNHPQPLLDKEGSEGWSQPTPCQQAQAKARNPYQPFFDVFPEDINARNNLKGVRDHATFRCLSYLQSLPENAVVPVEALNFVNAYVTGQTLSETVELLEQKKIAYQAYAQYMAWEGTDEKCDPEWFGLTLEDLGQQSFIEPRKETRGRKKQEVDLIPAVNPHEKLVDPKQPMEAAMNLADRAVAEMSETLVISGRVQAFNFMKKVATVSELKLIKELVDSKKYKGLTYLDADKNLKPVSDLETFCQMFLGVSYRKVKEDLDNLNAFGEDFLESSQRLGLGYRDLKKLRALPEEERELIINAEAVKVKDKDDLIELIEEMAAKHSREKEKLLKAQEQQKAELERLDAARQKDVKSLQQMLADKDALLKVKIEKIEELSSQTEVDPDEWLRQQEALINEYISRLLIGFVVNEEDLQLSRSGKRQYGFAGIIGFTLLINQMMSVRDLPEATKNLIYNQITRLQTELQDVLSATGLEDDFIGGSEEVEEVDNPTLLGTDIWDHKAGKPKQ